MPANVSELARGHNQYSQAVSNFFHLPEKIMFATGVLLSLLLDTAWASMCSSSCGSKAVYVLSNDPKGNNILSMPICCNGMLGDPVMTPTGGKGQYPITTLPTAAGIFLHHSRKARLTSLLANISNLYLGKRTAIEDAPI